MSISTEPPRNPPAKGVSTATLILSLALAVSTTAAVVLAVVHFRHPVPGIRGGSRSAGSDSQ